MLFIFGDPRIPQKDEEKSQTISNNITLGNLETSGIAKFEIVGKGGARELPKIRLLTFWKSCTWDQI